MNTLTLLPIAQLVSFAATAYLAGRQRGKFEVILIFDTLKFWKGKRFERDLFYNGNKDRNKDGKISYMELTFPSDGGHRTKLWEVVLVSLSVFESPIVIGQLVYRFDNCGVAEHWVVNAIIFITGPLFFLAYSLGFRHAFQKYRHVPPITKYHSDY